MSPKNQRVIRVATKAQKRHQKKIYGNIVELIAILAKEYMSDPKNASLKLVSPFGRFITLGRFDNSGKHALQLKLSTNQQLQYPGSQGKDWMIYPTWTEYLDRIDSKDRDVTATPNNSKRDIQSAADVQEISDMDQLLFKFNDLMCNEDDDVTSEIKEVKRIIKTVKNTGVIKKDLAKSILACLSWCPEIEDIEWDSLQDIPALLNKQLTMLKKSLDLPFLETEQGRAADSLFFVAACEHFRIPGADKYMRSCLKMFIENDELTNFSQIFGTEMHNSVCTLSPEGGTAITRDIFKHGKLAKLTPLQRKSFEEMSDSDTSNDSDADNDSEQKNKKNKNVKYS